MCREMSQYMPKRAVSSEVVAIAEGSAAQPGMPETPFGEGGPAPQQLHAAGAVAETQVEEGRGDHHCRERGDQHLAEFGAAGGWRGG